ncbi:hypothetical protein EAH86_17035 [Pedococcus bigeumensis]|uniref:Secreted protein n=1 Tax=Pedococcus bigeumensis TaxID=433644 RepID=A0A502CML2_9MICO|nr:hypothetical protein EAH86_17035 [Pedococcus bigeumensis]
MSPSPVPGDRSATSPAPATAPDSTSGSGSPSGLAGRLSPLLATIRASLEETPGRMRWLAAVGVAVALAFGLAGGQAFRSASGALERAGANTDQLVRIQAIQTNLVQADADATNAFLVGGLEPPAQRADYLRAVASATQLIAEAAQHQPADGAALGALNQVLVTYASEIESARSNNRQGLPVGAQYLKDASANLRADARPILKNLVDANNARVSTEFDNAGGAALWLVIAGLLALAVLVLELVWLARRTRRYVNIPLAAGAVVVLIALVAGVLALAAVGRTVDTVRTGTYAATLSTAKARIAAFDAKSNESLTLIARGSGSAFEKAWQTSDAAVRTELSHLGNNPVSAGSGALSWPTYEGVHKQIRSLDDKGDWDGAVRLATGTGTEAGNGSFAQFDTASARQLSSFSADASARLDGARTWLPLGGVLGVLAGLLAAACAWRGFSHRLEEYR